MLSIAQSFYRCFYKYLYDVFMQSYSVLKLVLRGFQMHLLCLICQYLELGDMTGRNY